MEKRKHISQMSPQEITLLKSIFRRVKHPIYTNYSLGRLNQRGIQRNQVTRALKIGELIEYHLVGRHHRVLIRGTAHRGQVVCVVLDIVTSEVVTVFKNSATDNHWTLNSSYYDKKVDILNLMKWSENIVSDSCRKRNSSNAPATKSQREVQATSWSQHVNRS